MAERESGKSRRGFASMDPEKQREIARKGGRAAHAKGTAHEFSPDEARAAGRKGGEVVSRNREYMAEIGRRGGEARGERSARGRAMPTDREVPRQEATQEPRWEPRPEPPLREPRPETRPEVRPDLETRLEPR